MAAHRIVCVDMESCSSGRAEHVVAVGIDEQSNHATNRQTVDQVLRALGIGEAYYTQAGNRTARVSKYSCSQCGRNFIRTHPDDTTVDNLDNLRACSWR